LLRAFCLLSLLFPDVFIPYFWMGRDIPFEQLSTLAAIEVDHFYSVGAQPVDSSGKVAALAYYQRREAKLPHQPAAIPARGERSNHDQVAIAALAAGPAEGVGFSMDAGIALLHPPIVALTYKLSGARKNRRPNRNASLIEPEPCLFERHCQHPFVQPRFRHNASLVSSIIVRSGEQRHLLEITEILPGA
jgi:hypothetical protein